MVYLVADVEFHRALSQDITATGYKSAKSRLQNCARGRWNLHVDSHLVLNFSPVVFDSVSMLPTPKNLKKFQSTIRMLLSSDRI